jgi:hypothetical protein
MARSESELDTSCLHDAAGEGTMQPVTRYARQMLDRQRDRYTKVIEGMAGEALNWRPGDLTTNTITQIVRHVYEGLPWLLSLGLDDAEPMDAEQLREWSLHTLRDDPATAPELLDGIATHSARADTLLARLDAHDLGEEVVRFGRATQRCYYVAFAADHGAEHMGHAELTKQLWEQRG